jgi:hypothetical protein
MLRDSSMGKAAPAAQGAEPHGGRSASWERAMEGGGIFPPEAGILAHFPIFSYISGLLD